ncbi:MAG: DUF58 domain-containing protein [Thermodesulfobacteriota bacterium]
MTSFPLTLDRHRLLIFPTAHGFLFIGVLFAMLLGSINYNNNLGFLLVFLLGGMALVSIVHTYRNLLGLVVLSVTAQPVFAGGDAVFDIRVRAGRVNRRTLVFFIEKNRPSLENIAAGKDAGIQVAVSTSARGVLRPGRLTISCRYPLGLFAAWAVVRPSAECVVYPAPLAGPSVHAGGELSPQEQENNVARGVDDFQGLKPYQPGDPIVRIAWKHLSSGKGLFLKEFFHNAGDAVMLDYEAVAAKDPETRLSRMCDMVLELEKTRLIYGLHLPGRTISPDRGAAHRHECLKALALFDADE